MKLQYVPLLGIQRRIYSFPRGPERFQFYLDTMLDDDRNNILYPLSNMNPMAREERGITKMLDDLIANGVDDIAEQKVEALCCGSSGAASRELFQVGIVLADGDGAWTQRTDVEYKHRFQSQSLRKRGWIEVLLWTSKYTEYTRQELENQIEAAIRRTVYLETHSIRDGEERTLSDLLEQECHVWSKMAKTKPENDALFQAAKKALWATEGSDYETHIACLFGDETAVDLGFQPIGGVTSDYCGLECVRMKGFC